MKKIILRVIAFISIGLVLSACFDMPKEPTLPVWDVNVNVPIAGDSYTMADILDTTTSEYLGIMDTTGIDDSLYFLLVDDIENITKLQDSIVVPPLLDPISTSLIASGGGESSVGFVINPDDEYHLIAATFSTGAFNFTLINNNANAFDYTIIIPGFKHKVYTDSSLTVTGHLQGNSTVNSTIDVAEFNYHELPVYEGAPILPPYDYQNAAGFLVVVHANTDQAVNVTIKTSTTEFTVTRLEGRLKRTELTGISEEVETGLESDIENFAQSIRLQQAKLTLNLQTFGEMSNIAIVFENMRIVGYILDDNDNVADSVILKFNGQETFTDSAIAGELYQKEFNETNSNVLDFFLALPKRIRISNNVILAPVGNDNQVVSATDSIKISASIYSPVIVAVSQASYDGDEDIDLSDDDKDQLDNVKSAYIKLFVENEIPAYVKAMAQIIDENDNVLFDLHDIDGNTVLTILPAEVDANGIPIGPKESVLSISVNQDEISQIINLGKKVRFSVFAYSTGSDDNGFGPFVRIKANYRISYTVSAGGVYHVDLEND